jgi:hypothetical protein
MFYTIAALAFMVVTMPIWGTAVAALFAFGIQLMFSAPWLLLLIFLAPFILRAFVWLAKTFQTFLSQNNNGNLESSYWSRYQANHLG